MIFKLHASESPAGGLHRLAGAPGGPHTVVPGLSKRRARGVASRASQDLAPRLPQGLVEAQGPSAWPCAGPWQTYWKISRSSRGLSVAGHVLEDR